MVILKFTVSGTGRLLDITGAGDPAAVGVVVSAARRIGQVPAPPDHRPRKSTVRVMLN